MNCIFCNSKMDDLIIDQINCSNNLCDYRFIINNENIHLGTSWRNKKFSLEICYDKYLFECKISYLENIIKVFKQELTLEELKEMLLSYQSNLIFM
jgi:hypothetical protein